MLFSRSAFHIALIRTRIRLTAHPLAGLKKYFQKKVIPSDQLPLKMIGKPIKVGGILTSFRKVTTKKGDIMAMLQIEDPFGKFDAVMFPKTYRENYEALQEDKIIFIDGILDKRNGEIQIVINKADAVVLEDLKNDAQKQNLWTEGEKIEHVSRQDIEDEEVAGAEEIMEVEEKGVKDVSDNLVENEEIHSIFINREVGKEFFIKLKKLLEKHPGNQKVQLVIGEKTIPAPMTVSVTPELEGEIEELMKEIG